jgi:hypothetical protein
VPWSQKKTRALSVLLVLLSALGVCGTAQTIATTNLGANQVTLNLTSATPGTGYFTLLPGSGSACGTAAQTAAGENNSGAVVIHGSLALMENTTGYYTVRNLAGSTTYTVCFTPDGESAPLSANFTTKAPAEFSFPSWINVGSAGFSAGGGSGASYQSLAFAPDGTPYVAFSDGGDGNAATVMKFDGTAWVVVGNRGFTAGAAYYEDLAFAPDGTPYTVFSDGANGWRASVMKFDGTAWVPVGSLGFSPSAGIASDESLAFAPDGTPYVAFGVFDTVDELIVMRFNGTDWVNLGSAGNPGQQKQFESLAFASDGTPYVVFPDGANNGRATAMKFDGGTWVSVGAAGFSPGPVDYLSLSLAPNGTLYVAFEDYAHSDNTTVMEFNGNSWGVVGTAGFSPGAESGESLAIAPDGSLYSASAGAGLSDGVTVMKFNGTSWVDVGSEDFSFGTNFESLAIAPDGTPYVAFQDNNNGGNTSVMKLTSVTPIVPQITTWPVASPITYGQTLASSNLTGGMASVPGTFAWTSPSTAPGAGTAGYSVTFTPSDTTKYAAVSNTVSLTVNKAKPIITTPPTSTDISYGQTLANSTLLGGVASVAGSFGWTAASTAPSVGTASYSVTFTPNDTTDYTTATVNVPVVTTKATPTITTAPSASAIIYGETLANSTLSGGVASVAGSFAWTTPTTAPNAGTASYPVTFTPNDAADYTTTTVNVSVVTNKATPTIATPPVSSTLTYGQTLASSILTGGVASVPGGFAWTTPTTEPNAGTASYSVTFTPINTIDYTTTTVNVSVVTIKAAPSIATLPKASTISYGQTLASSILTGGVASVPGSFAWTTPSTVPALGTASYSVTFTPTNGSNYTTVSGEVSVTVTQATPIVTTWPTASSVLTGQTLASSMLTGGTASVPGGFSWTSPATVVSSSGSYLVTFTPTDTAHYTTVPGQVAVTAITATIAASNVGANQVTLNLTSTTSATGYFTLLSGSGATCGTAAQTAAGENSSGAAAIHGSLALTANTAADYTVRNLAGSTAYTVCFTPDGNVTPMSSSVNTLAAASIGSYVWQPVGNAGFSAGETNSESLAFSPSGVPYVAFADGANGNKATVMEFNGTSWVTVGNAGFSAGGAGFVSLHFSPSGVPYVAYQDAVYSSGATVMEFNGSSWVTVGSPSFSEGPAYFISLAFSPSGVPYVAYEDLTNGGKSTVMEYNGSSWVTVGSADFSAGAAGSPSLAFSPTGVPYVAYQDFANGGKSTVMEYNGGSWVTVGSAGFSAGQAAFVSLDFSPSGVPYLAYEDFSNNYKATVMEYNGSSWVTVGSAGFTAGRANYTDLAFSPSGLPYVTYEDGSNGSKATVMEFNGSSWVPVGGADFSAGGATYESLVFSPSGVPYVAYSDAGNGGKATVMSLQPPSPAVVTGTATAITSTSATLNGTVNDNGAATTVSFDYGRSTSYGTNVTATTPAGGSIVAGTGNTAVAVGLTGLSPNTIYHFRVDATANGATVNGSDATFATSLGIPSIAQAPTASAITYGQTLASSTLTGGAASVPGSFAWTTPTTAPNAGTASYSVTFTPNDTTDYTTATVNVSVVTTKATPTIMIAPSASAITYGQTLASSTLTGGVGSVPGSFAWTTPTTAPSAGTASYSVTFTPNDTTDYTTTTLSVALKVNQAMPTLTWAAPSAITYGTALSAVQLDATASVPGSFAYSPAAGTIPPVGSDSLSVTFTPTDAIDYETATGTVTILVEQPTPVLASLSPVLVTAGGAAFSLTVEGSGFTSASVVYLGTSALATQYVSSVQITGQVPASAIAASGVLTISVQNPAPGGGASNSLQFEVDSASGSTDAPTFTTLTATVTPGATANYPVTLPSSASNVSATCLNLPAGATCSYSATNGSVSIATSSTTPAGTYQIIVVFTETVTGTASALVLAPFLLLPLLWFRTRSKEKNLWLAICCGIALSAALVATGCGGKSPAPASTQTQQVITSGSVSLTVR